MTESRGTRAFLVLCEHDPVFTLGRNADETHVLRRDPGVRVVRTDRGGEVTWHGPGQMVGYPVLALRAFRLGVRRFIRSLERALMALLAEEGVAVVPRPGTAGLWIAGRKIVSIGLRVARGVTSHGFALNAANDLGAFDWIHPCGDPAAVMTSLARETGHAADLPALGERFAEFFAAELDSRCDRSDSPAPILLPGPPDSAPLPVEPLPQHGREESRAAAPA